MIRRILLSLAAASLLGAPVAQANDSTASVGVGGLALLKSNAIRMESEELDISADRVGVRYRFLNATRKDLRATVAFPLPPYAWAENAGPGESTGPIREMRIVVDGIPIEPRVHRVATIAGRDVTGPLREIGLTEEQVRLHASYQVDGSSTLTDEQVRRIEALGRGEFPQWRVTESYYWEQVFPAGRAIEVTHEYQPFAGSRNWDFKDAENARLWRDYAARTPTCLAPGALRQLRKAGGMFHRDVAYVLGTGRNWKGPIGRFTLRIHAGTPAQAVSACLPGPLKRTGPSTLEFSRTQFVPQDRLHVHFFDAHAPQ